MADQHDLRQTVNHTRIVGDDHENNPFMKLIAGFCNPFVQNFDDSARNSDDSPRYAPDLGPQVPLTGVAAEAINNGNHSAQDVIDGNGFANGRDPATRTSTTRVTFEEPKMTTIAGTNTAEEIFSHDFSESSTNTDTVDSSELVISEIVTWMRRKRGIEVFIMSFLFVLATLLTLRELGYSIADFNVVVKDSQEFVTGHSKKLIDIVHKSNKPVSLETTEPQDEVVNVESLDDNETPPPAIEEPEASTTTPDDKDDIPDEAPIESNSQDIDEENIAALEANDEL